MEEKKNPSIAAIVVTYNRATLLLRCLDAIVNQTLVPDEIIIVDNHSSDETQNSLVEKGFINGEHYLINEFGELTISSYNKAQRPIRICYLYKNVNDGGAGGFYAGMKMAYDAGFDWLWMMDDDGTPDKNQLEQLLSGTVKHNLQYTNALVINEKNELELSFSLPLGNKTKTYKNLEVLENDINPFNGTFIKRLVIEKIGFIKKELFIWGDETEYTLRVRHNGFKIGTICQSHHYHPAKHINVQNTIPFWNRHKCALNRPPIYYRNYAYIFWKYNRGQFFKNVLNYTLAYGLRCHFKSLLEYYKYTLRGVREDWTPIQK